MAIRASPSAAARSARGATTPMSLKRDEATTTGAGAASGVLPSTSDQSPRKAWASATVRAVAGTGKGRTNTLRAQNATQAATATHTPNVTHRVTDRAPIGGL